MSATEKYEVGKFYWVWIVLDPDAANEWENQTVPARFAGYSETGEEVWNFLDPNTTEWPVRWSEPILVGAEAAPKWTGESIHTWEKSLSEKPHKVTEWGDLEEYQRAFCNRKAESLNKRDAQQYQAGYKCVEDGAYRVVLDEARKLAERLQQSEKALAVAMEVVALHQS